MTSENKKPEEHPALEKLEAVGQIIVGEIEKIGGALTGDPLTHAEGDYNIKEGLSHLKSSDADDETESEKQSE